MNPNWHRVSKNEPCPICHHTDWCILSNDGNVAICQRVESDRPTRNSGGWIHRLKAGIFARSDTMHAPACSGALSKICAPQAPDIPAYFAALPTGQDNLQDRMCGYLEKELGLPKEILMVLDWRWDRSAHAVAIPMRDAAGEVTGIRYRSLKNGAKWAKKGSKDGLFFDPEFIPYNAEELLVCEGPTDAAAAMACGFWCVGRSSCGTGRDLIRDLVRLRKVKRVTIVADDDKPKPRPGGGTWRPGYEGAVRLAEGLKMPYRIVLPPLGFKDLRDWYRSGTLDEVSLYRAVQGNRWYGPNSQIRSDLK